MWIILGRHFDEGILTILALTAVKKEEKKKQAQHSRLGISAKKPVGSFWNHAESTSVPPLYIYYHEDP